MWRVPTRNRVTLGKVRRLACPLDTRLSLLALAVSGVNATTACELEKACTLIGCESGLAVHLVGELPDSFTLTATFPGGYTVVECTSELDCRDHEGNGLVFLEPLVTPEVTIEVAFGDVAVSATYYPEYDTYRPNGPDCPPECRAAGITLDVSKARRKSTTS